MGPGEVLDVIVVSNETLVSLPVFDRWRLASACIFSISSCSWRNKTITQCLPNEAACDGGLLSRWYMQMILSSAPDAR